MDLAVTQPAVSVALITGGGGGIGGAVARLLTSSGGAVAAFDRSRSAVDRLAAELKGHGHEVMSLVGDITRQEDLTQAVAQVTDRWGRLDILVNAAGLTQLGGIADFDEADWDRVMNVNLKGTYLACKAAYPVMRSQRAGAVVNVASVSGRTKSVFTAPNYVASKAGVIGLTMSLASQWCPDGIRVNCVAPGLAETEMVAVYSAEQRHMLEQSIPMKRFARPQEVANAIVFLASGQASYITGETLNVNGGLFMV
jgi:NAD(P)-dependent dehydrogenase (short-subunit alcohol dehydrogenase family)